MKCPECKQSVKDTFKFCPECGEKLCHVQLEASDGKSPEQRSQHCDAVKQNPLEAPLLPRTEVPSDLCHTSQSGATQFDNKDATGTAKNRTCSLEKNEPQVDYQSSCLSMTDVSTSLKTAQTITQPSSIIPPVSQSNIHSLQSEPVVPSEEAATLALQDKGSKDTLLLGVKCQESEAITSQTLVSSSSGTSTESTRGPNSKEFQSSEDHTNAETTNTANTSSSRLTQSGHSDLPPSSLKNQPAVKPTHPENESLQKVIPGQEQPLISCSNPSSMSGSVNIGNAGKSSNENKPFTPQQSAGIQHTDGSANTTNKEKCSTHHSTKAKDLTTEKQQLTNQSNKPRDPSTITETETSKGSMCTDAGKNVPEHRKHSQDPQNKEDVQQQALTENITQSKTLNHQPQTSQITVFFHAILSKDFGMDPSKEILKIGAGFSPGTWHENVVKMEIERDLGYGFLVHGQLQLSKNIVGRAIPYKYMIQGQNYLVYEHIYKEDRNIANRSLFIRENLLTHQGEWHQYDDMIYPPPSDDLLKRISNWFFNMKQRILRERCLAGQVMLETIFGLLPEWNKTNVQNFFVQLKQFFRSYSNPYIYEEYPKPWRFLQYGEEEVKILLYEFMQRRVFLPLQSEGKAYAVVPDCVKAGIIILLVCIKYRLKHDLSEIQKVCQLLCFPAMPKDKFSSYWSEVMQALQEESVLDALKTLSQNAIEKKATKWILILPHLHFLKGESKPFEPNSLTISQDFVIWAGLKGIKMPENHLADPQHTRALFKVMETHTYLLDMDLLLSRSWMCLLGFNTLWEYTSSFPVDILDILVRLNYGLLSTKHFNSEEIFKPVLAHLFNKTKEAQHRFKEEEYAKLCLKTSVKILEKMCTSYKDPWKHDIPLACLKLLNFIINSRECHTKQEFTDGKVMSKNAEVFKATIKIVREWLQKTFTKPLLTCSHDYTDFTNLYEMEVWNNLITFDFTNEGFQSEWKSTFLKQFKGKFEKAKSIHQIEIYCNKIDEVTRKFPVLSSCLENCALAAVTSVCRNKSEKTLFEKLKEQDLSKFGKLISAIVLKTWPKTENGKYQDGLEAVIKHLLTWPTAKNVLQLQGANGKLIHQLLDDAKELMAMACSAFSNVAEQFIQGNITLKILKDILEEEDTFIEFLNIDGLCADGRCRNKRAVKSLLRKRRDEIEDILQEKEMVKCLLSVCQSLPVHIKVNAIELEGKQKSNIDLIPLDEFMEVHQLDDRSSDVTGVVTFFSISDTIKKMARTLHAMRESYIFMECWNSQVREVSGNLQADDENQTQLLYTLDQLHQNIFQPCFNKFEEIYTCLKDGTITFQMIDSVFENLKGNHEKLKEDLDIMCNINPKDYKQWTKRRTEQIQQYHDLHSAVKSAEVIMEVKEIVCPEGNFQVLKRLHDISRADFKDESLDQIDENLISTKEVLADITEARRECLQELGKRRNFVQWVKETLKEINDLKVFVDLASISAGENDMDVDRVACFHDAVLGYSSVLYGLTFDSDFDEFQKTLQKLWQALENDSNITNKLRDSARHLDWLKTVKESHGSVELSSMSLVKTINDKGSYIISVKNQKKLLLENVIRLHVIEEHEEGPEVRCYSLEDMIDLQNKLMLMTGKAEQGTHEVEHFMEVFDHVQRLAKAFINLLAAGNPLFRKWEAKIKCNNKSNPGITVDLNLSTVQNEIQLNGNASGQLSVLCRKMEGYLSEWRNFMDKQRCGNYYLNYYTAEQIMCLCENLCQKNVNTYLKEDVLMMLSFVNPKCTTSDIWNIWNKVFTDLAETLDSPNTQGKVSFLDNQLVTKADDIETLDRFWYDYTRDMKSFLPDTLDIPSLGKLLEKLANTLHCNDEDEAMEEFMPLDPQDKQITRQFPRGLLEGRPNLIVCPHNEVLPSCISIYCNSAYEALPTYDEVLLCSLATSYEYVELFLRRCLTKGYTGKKIYSLLFADQLSYEVSYATEQLFQRLNLQGKTDYQLVIICSSEYEHAYIPSAFSQFKLHMVPREALQRIQTYLSRHYTVPPHQNSAGTVFKDKKCVGIVSSKRAGVGKSLYIQRLYEKLEEFSGSDTSFLRCIRLNEHIVDENAVLQSLQETPNQDGLVIFHFDVTTSVQKGLHEFLFKLLVLGYLMDTEGHMWKCSKQHLYVIEMLQCNSEPLQFAQKKDAKGAFSFLEIFPKIQCRPPKEVLEMEIELEDDPTLEIEDPLMDDQHFSSEAYQRPYQYLRRFHEGVDLDNFTFSGVEGSHVECLQMLFFYCGIVDPSWAELKNFVWFLNLQLQDCETSDFCNMELVGDTLRGFRNFVVDFMILMAKDFATPSLTISDQSPGRHQADLQGDNEEDLAPFRIRKRWESEPHPYIFFNDDHVSMTFIGFHLKINDQKEVDAIDPNTNKVIRKNIMTKALYDGLVHQRVPFNIDFHNLERYEKIEHLCSVMGIKWPTDPEETYELTMDNILKMMAIHMRFRCGIPVVVMGETGCGKTRLIKFLCDLRRGGEDVENLKLVKVHGGTTPDMIYNTVKKAETIAISNKQDHGFDTVLFFDEANTTEAISCIKEVLCDKTIKGQKLDPQAGLQIIAACNPYRKHSDEMIGRLEAAGLGYKVRTAETEDRLGSIPLRQLVYRVHLLPPSLIPLVWDFGQLNDFTEQLYINQIVQNVTRTNLITENYVEMITDILSASQDYMRKRTDECSFVSLRDVERCMKVFVWFYGNHNMFFEELENVLKDKTHQSKKHAGGIDPTDNRKPVEWSLLMAVAVCYSSCLENKNQFWTKISKFFPSYNKVSLIMQEISLMQDLLLSGVPLGDTIAKNKALKENVFMMVVCIELRIPLFLVGKPGSSKSLSKTLVADAMQGQAAHSELYKRFKQIHLVSYQCSPHSTAEGIISTFKQCARFQEGKNLKEYISVVVLDEIGLAEDSPKMPLKTLHPLLEEGCIDDDPLPHKKVGFIGISNWALDPAKMNRGIFVSRGDPDENELIESAKGICSSNKIVLENIKPFFQHFAVAYSKICLKQKEGFFGLRDFYSLIKMVFVASKVSSPSEEQIIEAVLRNFSGWDDVDAVQIFSEELLIQPNLDKVCTVDLVRQNIDTITQDGDCRYLLILTKNFAALQILQQTFFKDDNLPEIIFGSSFPKDQEYTQICKNINRVKICMETGRTVVLLNLQNLYESLYDALNQYYVTMGGQKYVDLGLGTHRVKCRVHKDFRLIVIEEKEVVYSQFPIPLINRLEKHYLDINSVLNINQRAIVKDLQSWVEKFVSFKNYHYSTHTYTPSDVFVGYHSDTCSSVVLQVMDKLKDDTEDLDTEEAILQEAKFALMNCATPDSVVRLEYSDLSDAETKELIHIYFQRQSHYSLSKFIASHIQQEQHVHSVFTEITTFSRLLTAADVRQLQSITGEHNIDLLSLQQFETEFSFLRRLKDFLQKTYGDRILLVQIDFDDSSVSANILASARYSTINEITKSEDSDGGRVFVCFITKLPRMDSRFSYKGFQGGHWMSVHIDDLRSSKDMASDIQTLSNLSICELFEEKTELLKKLDNVEHDQETISDNEFLVPETEHSASMEIFDNTALVRSCIQSALSMLRDPEEGGRHGTRRLDTLLTLLENTDELRATFIETLRRRLHLLLKTHEEKVHMPKNWVSREASNIGALQEGGTFKHTLWRRIQIVIIPLLAHLISVIDRNCNLDLLLDENCNDEVKNLWLLIFGNKSLLDIPYVQSDQSLESETILIQSHISAKKTMSSAMPFSWRIKELLDDLWVHILQREGQTQRQFEDVFKQTVLGEYFSKLDVKTHRDFFQRYLQDFVVMTMKVTKVAEQQLLCEALASCVNELSGRAGRTMQKELTLTLVHTAYNEFQNRLQNFSRMISILPPLAFALQDNPHVMNTNEMVLDVFCALACVEHLEPKASDSEFQWQLWLKQVKRLQVPIELVCSEHSIKHYGERSREIVVNIHHGWNRIFILSIFVKHVLSGIESEDERLKPLITAHIQHLGKVLEKSSDMKQEKTFVQVITILKSCKQSASELNFKFGLQSCSICMTEPKEPVELPCNHIFCRHCLRNWLTPDKMFCAKCTQQVPDDFQIKVSEEIQGLFKLNGQFRQRCNAFFIELVSTLCFKDNSPPSRGVILHLLSFLMIEAKPASLVQAQSRIHTKDLSPFDECVDSSPIVRSVVLKLLLKYSFDEVQEYLQQHLTEIEASKILDGTDKTGLYTLYINCLEDSMFKKKHLSSESDQMLHLKEGSDFLRYFFDSGGAVIKEITIETLQQIARLRLCLDMAAQLISVPPGASEEHQIEFMQVVLELCERSGNDWYRVYLIRKVSSSEGMEVVQNMLRRAELQWLFPQEVLLQDGNNEAVQMDQYLVYGDVYQAVREAVAKALMEGRVEDINQALENFTGPPRKGALYILLALYREVTTLYRVANPALHPTREQCQFLEGFIQSSRYLVTEEIKLFATALVNNRLDFLMRFQRTGTDHFLTELIIHLNTVLLCGPEDLLAPLKQLGLSPENMQMAFIPTMPEDMLATAQKTLGFTWYACPNGHPCVVDKCGRPMQRGRCLECGAEIGGESHRPVQGFTKIHQQGDRTQTGHILGDPLRRDNPDSLDTKSLSLTPFILVRMLTHLTMLLGASQQPQSQYIAQIIKPAVQNPCEFLMQHLQKDLEQLGKALGKGADETVTTAHLLLSWALEPPQAVQWPARYNNTFSTKDARNAWELTFANDIITPKLKKLEQKIEKVNTCIRNDSRVSSNPILKLVFGDPRLFLSALPQDSSVYSSAVWSCRKESSLLSLTHIVEQNDGKDSFPLLWRFLQKEAQFRLIKFLPDIVALQRNLVKKFQNLPDGVCGTIKDFIQRQTSVSARKWFEKRIQIFLSSWNQLRVSLANYEINVPGDYCSVDLNEDSELQVLIPRRKEAGLCATALLSYLVSLHNQLIDAVDKHTEEDSIYTVSLAELSELHVIGYEEERDLLPLIVSNCQYTMECGHVTVPEYDLAKIQQQIFTQFLQGKPHITLLGIPTLISRQDRNYESIFKDITEKVPQEPLTSLCSAGLVAELQSLSDVCEALTAVEVSLGFLAMTGEDGSMSLEEYMINRLQMGKQTAPHILKTLSRCSLKHCVALWQLLMCLRSEYMLRLKRDPFTELPTEYKDIIGEEQKALTVFVAKSKPDIWLLEMHEFLLLKLKNQHAKDTFKPEWSLKDTLASYMERKNLDVPLDVEEYFPDEIQLSQSAETWKFIVTVKHQDQR